MPQAYRSGSRDNPVLAQAYQDALRLSIPQEAYLKFRQQVSTARRRGIPWEFSLPVWWAWRQTEDRWSQRGRGRGRLVMARFGDAGPYAPGNVFPATPLKNAADRPAVAVAASAKKTAATRELTGRPLGVHLRVRGDGHPKARAVLTPAGRFGSAALAADHFAITRAGASKRARKQLCGWSYDTEPSPAAP